MNQAQKTIPELSSGRNNGDLSTIHNVDQFIPLAERGATAHEIMAVTGHQSLEEVERYTRAVRKSQLANSAMNKLKR